MPHASVAVFEKCLSFAVTRQLRRYADHETLYQRVCCFRCQSEVLVIQKPKASPFFSLDKCFHRLSENAKSLLLPEHFPLSEGVFEGGLDMQKPANKDASF